MVKKAILAKLAPTPIGPYSQAVEVEGWLYISGQLPIDLATNQLATSYDVATKLIMNHLNHILMEGDFSMKDLIIVTIYLTDMNQFASVNEVYKSFVMEPYPARVVVEVNALPKQAIMMVDAIAKK